MWARLQQRPDRPGYLDLWYVFVSVHLPPAHAPKLLQFNPHPYRDHKHTTYSGIATPNMTQASRHEPTWTYTTYATNFIVIHYVPLSLQRRYPLFSFAHCSFRYHFPCIPLYATHLACVLGPHRSSL
jgi:hypothetical protein